MTTVFDRIYKICKKESLPFPSLETKQYLGKIIIAIWFDQPKKTRPFIYKIKKREGHFMNSVWCYPESFSPTIDKIIMENFNKQNIGLTVQVSDTTGDAMKTEPSQNEKNRL